MLEAALPLVCREHLPQKRLQEKALIQTDWDSRLCYWDLEQVTYLLVLEFLALCDGRITAP